MNNRTFLKLGMVVGGLFLAACQASEDTEVTATVDGVKVEEVSSVESFPPASELQLGSTVTAWDGAFEADEDRNLAVVSGDAGGGGKNIYRKDGMIPDYAEQTFAVTLTGNVVKLPESGVSTIEFLVKRFDENNESVGSRRGIGDTLELTELGPFEHAFDWNLAGNPDDEIVMLEPALKINANSTGEPIIEIQSWSIQAK